MLIDYKCVVKYLYELDISICICKLVNIWYLVVFKKINLL